MNVNKFFIIVFGFLTGAAIFFLIFFLLQNKNKENQEIKNLRAKLNQIQTHYDSLQMTYLIETQEHAKDTLRLLLFLKESELNLQKTKTYYHEKISSIDNISADSAYLYLSKRY